MRRRLTQIIDSSTGTRRRTLLVEVLLTALLTGAPSVALAASRPHAAPARSASAHPCALESTHASGGGHRSGPCSATRIVLLSDASAILPAPGARYQLRAVVRDAAGRALARRLTWRSSDPHVASVSGSGLLEAHAAIGSATIAIASPGLEPVAADVIIAQPAPHTVLIPSSAVISSGPGQVVLRKTPLTSALQPGETLVSGSGGGVLAIVRSVSSAAGSLRVSTAPASLARAFTRLDVHSAGARQAGVLALHGGTATLTIPGGAPLAQAADDDGTLPCDSERSGDVQVSVAGASMEAPVTFEPYANLGSTLLGGVQLFELGVRVSVPLSLNTGSVQIAAAGEGSVTCELTLPLSLPSPVWVGPVEIAPSLTPSIGATIDAHASGSLTLAGPTLGETINADDGVRWTPQGGWQAITQNSASSPTLQPASTHLDTAVSASIDPFLHLDAGVSAQLLGLFSLQDVNLAYIHADGDLSLSMHAPFADLQAGYTGPSWSAAATLSAGPELALGEGALSDLWKALGLDPPDTQWSLYSQSWTLGASPDPSVSATPGTLTSGSVALKTSIPASIESLAGDQVQFIGYKNGSSEGAVLATATIEAGPGSSYSAAATWGATAAADGSWQIVALVFDPIFGPLQLPYASSQPTAVTVNLNSDTGGGEDAVVPTIAPGSLAATPASLEPAGGKTTITASVENAATCSLEVTPTTPSLPAASSCADGNVSIPLTLPANNGNSPVVYKITLTATGASGTTPATAATTVAVNGGEHTPPPGQSIESAIAPAESLILPEGAQDYLYVGSTAGGFSMSAPSWSPDLDVTAAYSGNQAIFIGQSSQNSGSYTSTSGNHAIAGVALNGYEVVRTFSAHESQVGPGYSGGPETPAAGVSLDLPFTTEPDEVVVILVGGEGTGELALSGIAASTLQDETYSEAGSHVLASTAIYSASLPAGNHDAHWSSSTYLTNSGTSLGAVAYVLRPR